MRGNKSIQDSWGSMVRLVHSSAVLTMGTLLTQGQIHEILFGGVDIRKICRCMQDTQKKLLDMPTTSPLVPLGRCHGTVVIVVYLLECLYRLSGMHVWVWPSTFGGRGSANPPPPLDLALDCTTWLHYQWGLYYDFMRIRVVTESALLGMCIRRCDETYICQAYTCRTRREIEKTGHSTAHIITRKCSPICVP